MKLSDTLRTLQLLGFRTPNPAVIAVAELDAELALEQELDRRRREQLRRP
jgi:hypothetical protein